MTEKILTGEFKCQDDQWRTVTVAPCKPEGLKALVAILRGTYKPHVEVRIEDHPERRHNLWDGSVKRAIVSSPIFDHEPLTRETITYGKAGDYRSSRPPIVLRQGVKGLIEEK